MVKFLINSVILYLLLQYFIKPFFVGVMEGKSRPSRPREAEYIDFEEIKSEKKS